METESKVMKDTSLVQDRTMHRGFQRVFAPRQLTVGLILPIESYRGAVPTMQNHATLAQRAEQLGFAALWVRDVPLHVPNFGDVGQIFDPWVYLGYLAAQTESITLATGSTILPLRHPLHLAKSAASVDQLSDGRLVLGIASGDRSVEFPAFGVDFDSRGNRFQETLSFFRQVLEERFPTINSSLGTMHDSDLLPKPLSSRIPAIVTGYSRQSLEWIAANADGWLYYLLDSSTQARIIEQWYILAEKYAPGVFKPFAQGFNLDLAENPDMSPIRIHSGIRLGRNWLSAYLENQQQAGVNHAAFNLKYGSRPANEVIDELGEYILPRFGAHPRTNAS